MKSGYWQSLTTQDFEGIDSDRTIAVLPVAAIEQHGPHLPLATDAVINAGIIEHALELLSQEPVVLVLPAVEVGHSLEHTSFPGTLTADAATLIDLWCEIGRSVARAGVRKLVILNSHGGQRALVDIAAVKLRAELGMLVVRANYFGFGCPEGLFDGDEIAHGLHGGEIETSLMLHLAPELVRREALDNFASKSAELAAGNGILGIEKPVGIGWMSEDLNIAGVCGNAKRADADRGRVYLEYVAARLAELCAEVSRIR